MSGTGDHERNASGPLAVFGLLVVFGHAGSPCTASAGTQDASDAKKRAKGERNSSGTRAAREGHASGIRSSGSHDRKRVGRVPAGGSATGGGTADPVDRAACPVTESARSSPSVAMLRELFRPRSRRIPDAVLSAGRERPGRRHAEKNEEAARVRVPAGIGFRRSVCGAMMAARSAGGAFRCSPSQQGAARPSPFVPSSSACPPVCGARPRGPGPFTEGVVPMRANRPAGGPASRRARFS